MATARKSNHTLRLLLSAASVELTLGVIRGCTVAKANVQAQGKVVFLDKAGAITRDAKLAVRELPVFTDEKFLETLMSSAAKVGPRVKSREDHNDAIGARAGFFDGFKLEADRVVADLHLFASYRNRDIVLETAAKTPEEIGLSIDFIPEFEIQGDRALMRVQKLTAVDIVDEGAITPGGLFLSAGVDSEEKKETPQSVPPMPDDKKTPSNEEIMAALGALTKTVGECVAAMNAMKTGAGAAAAAGESDAMKAIRESNEKLAADLKAQGERLNLITADNAKMKKERALLGFRGTSEERAALEQKSAEDIEKMTAGQKTYLQLVDERVASEKCSRAKAHEFVRTTNAAAYREHLKAKGVYDPAKEKTAA
jgi:hypothetical protein